MAVPQSTPPHPKFKDLTGKSFGRLTVVRENSRSHGKASWLCRCECGRERIVDGNNLRSGHTKSCGCLRKEMLARRAKHGHAAKVGGTAEYRAWQHMITRCYYPKVERYPYYGGRGITVCDRWQGKDGFVNFLADMGLKPSPTHSIDRIDANGNYEPSNCRWATRREQSRNRTNHRFLTCDGVTRCVAEWAEVTGLAVTRIRQRVFQLGWDVHKALTEPVRTRPKKRPPAGGQ